MNILNMKLIFIIHIINLLKGKLNYKEETYPYSISHMA